ncbi:mechanosensitive ion channel family protein [Roseovarius atlanticus]|uniref:mechanosensitive ion channel family protein n=2 Tax=Roseovarius atlanticus TaxID=1641875 RepID=UPI001C93CD87|nr:mechanosensitive ion channel domain-containing protein [Roseovarius atlanticus]MBY5988454.1 mechanosensitive ion channel family protein [Roseovarius atlanticus]MBY6123845.1 mechanosensitive ion channel family protein [Roseovarius atlanticus]
MTRPMHIFAALLRSLLAALFVLVSGAVASLAQEPYFEIDLLNPGLPQPPASLDRDTPRSTVESLLAYFDKEEYGAAAHLLDLGDLPLEMQANRGADLARQLKMIIDRQVLIPWTDLSDRPDGWLDGAEEDPDAGRVRRSILLNMLELDKRPVPLRLNRVKPANGDAVWLISRQSVRDIPALYERFRPTELEMAMPSWARERGPFGMYIWEWLALPVITVVAFLLGYIAYRLVGWLGQFSSRRIVQACVRAFRLPATIMVISAVIGFTTNRLLVVTGPISVVVGPLVLLGYVIGFALAAVRVADEIFDRVSLNSPEELANPGNAHYRNMATMLSGFRKFVIILAVIAGAATLLSSVQVFNSLGYTLLAGAGAVTIVLGFAAREVLGNLLAAVQIALNRSARIGDQIIFEDRFCTVERIHFTYVQLAIWTGNRFIVPVSHFVKHPFENLSAGDREMTRPIRLTFAQTADVSALRTAFFQIMDEIDDGTLGSRDDAGVWVEDQDIFGKKVLFALPTPDQSTFWDLETACRERLLTRAAELEKETGKPFLPQGPVQDYPGG